MSVANLSITSFGVTPDITAEAPDVYSSGGLDSLASPANITSNSTVNSLIDSMTPKQVTEFLNDPKVKEYAESTKQSVQSVATEIKAAMPKSSSGLGDLMSSASNGDIMGVFKQAKRLKESTPSSTYNNLSKDVFNKTMEFGGGITNQLNPLGDYFCKQNAASLNGGTGFDLDAAMQAALEGAKLALSALGKCGFDTVAGIDNLDVSSGLKLAIGLTVAGDGAKNGNVDSVGNLFTRFADSVPVTTATTWAKDLASSFMPGESTLDDETNVFTDTLTDLCPDFAVEGSPMRTTLMDSMTTSTLETLTKTSGFEIDSSLILMAKETAEDAGESLERSYGIVA